MNRIAGTAARRIPLEMRRDRRLADLLAEASTDALRNAAPSLKAIRAAGAGSKQTASRWQTSGEGSPVVAHSEMIYALALRPGCSAGALVAHARSTLTMSLMQLPRTSGLVERYFEIVRSLPGLRAAADTALIGRDVDMVTVSDTALALAGALEDLAAVTRLLAKDRINPYAEGAR